MSVPILVIDDEAPIRRLLRTSLGTQGFEVFEAADAAEGLALLARQKPDIVLLDLGLPDRDGLDIVRDLRAAGDLTPIVVLSARGEERAKIAALDLGADDYVTKPFSIGELVARIRAALRHRIQQQGGDPVFQHAGLRVDLTRREITADGVEVKLSPKEFDILRLLVLNAGKVVTQKMIMRDIWGAGGDVQYLRIYIRQIRQKLERDPQKPERILTETGIGYRLASA
jgi:two-component system KDP operon response regulator KdpE